MHAQADILRLYIEGLGLLAEYGDADWTRKAYIAKHWDVLTKICLLYTSDAADE